VEVSVLSMSLESSHLQLFIYRSKTMMKLRLTVAQLLAIKWFT
jgi:hypothetical protein